MIPIQDVFCRYEKKYMLTQTQYKAVQNALTGRMEQDIYGLHTVGNIYLDTDSYALIRASIEKPLYKEKFRVRCYGTPNADGTAFLELKKKYKGIVYKRRAPMPLTEATAYILEGRLPKQQSQILREIDWFMGFYLPVPKVLLAYDRVALFGLEDPAFRVTFDDNIRFRTSQIDLAKGSWGTPLIPQGNILMEVKTGHALPLWFSNILADLAIFPTSFSKYGTCYTEYLAHDSMQTGGVGLAS